MFWALAGGGACVPAVPSVDDPSSQAGAGRAGQDVFADAGAPTSPTPTLARDAGTPRAAPDDAARDGAMRAETDAAVDLTTDTADGTTDRTADGLAGSNAEPVASPDGGDAQTSDASTASEIGATARAPQAGELVIDELLVDPAGDDLGHEWFEVVNVAGAPLDLASLHVSDGTTDAAVNAGVLAPGGLLVLGQTTDRAHNGDAPVAFAYGTRLALNNGGDRIAVCWGPCASGLTLDAVAWTAAWGPGYVGHAVVVDLATGATCPASTPYGADGNYGSPGQPNPPCPDASPSPVNAPPEMSKLPAPG